MTTNAAIMYFLSLFLVVYSVASTFYSLGRMGTRKIVGLNNSELSKHYLLLLLGQAKHKMIIYDDGDEEKDTYYWDEEVLRAFEEKLQEFPELTFAVFVQLSYSRTLEQKVLRTSPSRPQNYGVGRRRTPRCSHKGDR